MKKITRSVLAIIFGVSAISSCLPSSSSTAPILPEDEFSRFDKFGDGFIAKININDSRDFSPEEVVSSLVEQWLEHYKSVTDYQDAAISDYNIDKIRILESPPDSNYSIVAGVSFSIIPRKTPSDFGGFPGEAYNPSSPWWDIAAPFGVIKLDDYYYLRLVFGWGT